MLICMGEFNGEVIKRITPTNSKQFIVFYKCEIKNGFIAKLLNTYDYNLW